MNRDGIRGKHLDQSQRGSRAALGELLRPEVRDQERRFCGLDGERRQQLRLVEEDAHRSDAERDACFLRQRGQVAVDPAGALRPSGHSDDHQWSAQRLAAEPGGKIDFGERELGRRPVDETHAGEQRIGAVRLHLRPLHQVQVLRLSLLQIVVHSGDVPRRNPFGSVQADGRQLTPDLAGVTDPA